MKKTLPSEENQLLELLEENRYSEWVNKNGRKAVILLMGLMVILVIIFRLAIAKTSRTEDDFIQADQLFSSWTQAADSGAISQIPTGLQQLDQIMQQNPSLYAKFDGPIAQSLLSLKDGPQAVPFAERTLLRTSSDQLKLYHVYAKASLLISLGKEKEALDMSKELQNTLQDIADAPVLTEYNLLRLAILEQKIGTPQEELKAWQHWQQQTQQGKSLAAHKLSIGQVDLDQYVQARQKALATSGS